MLYASYLKDGFNTTAIAVSGDNDKDKKISSFLWLKEHYTFKNIQDTIFLNPNEVSNIIQKQSKPLVKRFVTFVTANYQILPKLVMQEVFSKTQKSLEVNTNF